MSDPNYDAKLRIFGQIRMHPWIPEHKLFIDAQLAMMDVMEPERAESIRKQYEDKMKAYLSEQITQKEAEKEELVAQIEPEEVKEEVKEEKVEEVETDVKEVEEVKEEKPKRGRKPKSSSQS